MVCGGSGQLDYDGCDGIQGGGLDRAVVVVAGLFEDEDGVPEVFLCGGEVGEGWERWCVFWVFEDADEGLEGARGGC